LLIVNAPGSKLGLPAAMGMLKAEFRTLKMPGENGLFPAQPQALYMSAEVCYE
jgi:hypothetical protein